MEKKYFEGRFEDKVMIITGAARGIGRATALRAAKEGAKVVLVDRLKQEGEETLMMIQDNGGEAIFLNLDLSIEDAGEKMVQETISTYGKLDIAINNAGVMGSPSPLHELPQENMEYTMANN
ncbi:MAG: SDR family NAD(P)-dependent oxidoreductase, partial [Turicibacter sp.]